ncbi:MAG: hypothetical protein JW939_09620 [Candidatus Thermoplasmatota archaeon]|nr:hypothetical protein [Candidatus Thermoplasmatota archaeon]
MKLLVGGEGISKRLLSRLGPSGLVLFKYNMGSGGDVIMKQLFDNVPEGSYSILISTHQTDAEMREDLSRIGVERPPELVSMLALMDRRLSEIQKRDRFISEGIMVTDLIEISSCSDERVVPIKPHLEMLSKITEISYKQILPFSLVLDSIVDLVEETSREEVVDRLRILKKALREKGGIALVGCSLGYQGFSGYENTLFDAVIEVKAERKADGWSRTLTFVNIKGSGELPEEWPITVTKDVPAALEVQ